MAVSNAEIAELLNRLADLLEIAEANPFRVRAYRNAARTVADLPQSAQSLIAEGADLSALPAIGEDLAGKIAEIVATGHLRLLDEVARRTPAGLAAMTALPGLGPKRVKALHDALGITTLEALAAAAKAGKVRRLHGFGPKTEQGILRAIKRLEATGKRTRLAAADAAAGPLVTYLQALAGVEQVVVAGSFRRRKDTVGDLDILVTAARGAAVIERFVAYDEVARVVSKGTTRSTVYLRSGLQVDLRVVPRASYGAALHYFTGSKAHNIQVRALAVKKGLKINEYGVFRGSKRVAGRTEAEVYRQVGLPYIAPELREARGEIEAARAGRLPRLVTLDDIRGDLHCHTTASDGRASLEEMALAARDRGYAYLAISDHSRHLRVAHGLDPRRLARQIDAIERLNQELDGFVVLKSAEVDILEDGALDLPDSILRRLDFTLCAVHSAFDLPPRRQTERIIRAMDNPCFTILAHPTGRLLGRREPSPLDMERLMRAALERGCYLEVNAQPDRLDLTDVHCRLAKEMGLKIAISTDAHSAAQLGQMRLGVDQARRGWLEPVDVLNTRTWSALRRLLARR